MTPGQQGEEGATDPRAELAALRSRLAAAEHARAQLAAALDNLSEAFFALDEGWRFTYVNRAAASYFARAPQELAGKVLWSEYPQAWDSPFGREYRRAFAEQRFVEFEAYSTRLGRWFDVHVHPSPTSLSVYFHDVTPRHEAQAAARELEVRARAVVEHSMDAVLLTAPDGRIAMANRAASALFGYSESELQELGRDAVVVPDDPRLAAALEQRRRTGRYRGELTLKKKDGTHIPVEMSSAVFHDGTGAAWTSMFVRDISARLQREAERDRLARELERRSAWLQTLLDHVPLGVIRFEPNGSVVANRRAEELFAMRIDPRAGAAQYAGRLLFPDGSPVPPEQLVSARVLRTGETVLGAEFIIERPDGSRVPILGSAAPIRDTNGAAVGAVGVFQDVSDRMKAEARVRANERLLEGVFRLLPVGVWIADGNGRILRANPAGLRIWAGARYVGVEQFGEYEAYWLDSGERITEEEWALARAVRKGETSIGELIRIHCFDGSWKTIFNSALPLYDEHHAVAGAVVVNEDVTVMKEAEEAARRAVEARDEVLAIVAHDVRNPLNALMLQIDRLARHTHEAHEVEVSLVDAMRAQLRRINRLVEDLLDIARIEAGALRVRNAAVSAEHLLREVGRSQLELADRAGLTLEVGAVDPQLQVWADHDRLLQVIENLVGNAIKFTARGGRIALAAHRDGRQAVFRVSDSGRGIAPELLPHLFDRYWQARGEERRGAGLGLTIAKGIVEAHRGQIWVESRLGAGTTLYFTIPLTPPVEAHASSS